MRRTFLIDTDTASDDAVALIMALRADDVDVAAITTVAGNVPLAQSTRNALYTVELCGCDAPVFAGAGKPLLREYVTATWFHGEDGLGDHGYPEPRRKAESSHAVDAIIATVHANPGLTLVTLGPLTNIALALARDPSIVRGIGRCVVMGGNPCTEGNVTPAAEYNIWVDPEAARMVLHSGLPMELVGWQLCRGEATVNLRDIQEILQLSTPRAQYAVECNSTAMEAYRVQTGEAGISLPDPVAMAIALDPAVCSLGSNHRVEVETASELTRGMTVVDRLNVSGNERNRDVWRSAREVRVCWAIDNQRWKRALFTALS